MIEPWRDQIRIRLHRIMMMGPQEGKQPFGPFEHGSPHKHGGGGGGMGKPRQDAHGRECIEWIVEYKLMSNDALVAYIFMLSISFPVTVIVNSLTMLAISRRSVLHTPSFVLLFGLALAGLTTALFAQSTGIAAAVLALNSIYECTLLRITNYSLLACWIVTCLILAVITLDRFLAIFHPYLYVRTRRKMTRAKTAVAVAFGIGTIGALGGYLIRAKRAISIVCILMIIFLLSWNVYFFCRLRRLRRRVHDRDRTERVHRASVERGDVIGLSNRFRGAKVSLMTVCFTFVCFIPPLVMLLLNNKKVHTKDKATPTADPSRLWLALFAIASTAVYPLVYGWYLSEFRSEMRKMLGCCTRRSRGQDPPSFSRQEQRSSLARTDV